MIVVFLSLANANVVLRKLYPFRITIGTKLVSTFYSVSVFFLFLDFETVPVV